MTAFKSKRPSEAAPGASPNSSVSGGASGQPRGSISGPITKVMHGGLLGFSGAPPITIRNVFFSIERSGLQKWYLKTYQISSGTDPSPF